jgi:hypothetical protein
LAGVQACRSKVDPDQGHFSCTKPSDCGEGWECIAQFAGGGLCYRAGTCDVAETCDGVDQNCDGRIDETFPESGAACTTGLLGLCSAGTRGCSDGGLVCTQSRDAGVESCNTLDDDCDGTVDEGFDLTSDPANCGSCGRICPGAAGTGCRAGNCFELNCGDGVDNDTDGGTDCADLACLGATCATDFNCGGNDVDAGVDAGTDAGFDPDAGMDGGELDGGADAGMDAGTDAGVIIFCVPKEAACDNGADDDLDGMSDCADPDCDGKTCATGTVCTARVCPPAG